MTELAERWGELNVVHSFREGNTRTQFVFFSELCEQAGYCLDTEAFLPGNPLREEFVQARFHGQDTGRNSRLAAVLDQVITAAAAPAGQGADPHLSRATDQGSVLRAASFPQPPTPSGPGRGGSARPAPGISRARGRGGHEAGR